MFVGGALIVGGWGVVGWDRKSYLGPAEIASFSSGDLSPSNKHDTSWHFYEPLLFQIFFPLKFIKLRPSLSSINFAINNHADNLFSIYISFFQILYNMKSIFLFKYTLRFFIFKFDLNVKQSPYFFPVKVMVCRKNSIENKSFFSVDYVKITELQVVTSHAIWVDDITGVMISIKKINKN